MVGEKIKICGTVKGSSLLEVIVAMAIMLAIFTMSLIIYTNIMKSSNSMLKLKASALLQNQLIAVERGKSTQEQTFIVNELMIKQQIKFYGDDTLLMKLDLCAYNLNHEKIYELQSLIRKDGKK